MIIEKFAFGNKDEAFVEDGFIDGLNIIFSNDNNKGKTLVLQGIMYSIGYDSIFPSSFNRKSVYFYSKINFDGNVFEFLRRNNSILVKRGSGVNFFNSIRDFKYYVNGNVFNLPKINKDGRSRVVDLSLFYEIFFVGQDKRTSSNLISRGEFNKTDFKNMVLNFSGIPDVESENVSIEKTKSVLSERRASLKDVMKKIKIINKSPRIARMVSSSYDSKSLESEINNLSSLHGSLSELIRERQREINRKSKLEKLISELNSLNRELTEGRVQCAECGSGRVIYSNDDIKFDVSNLDVRNNIIESIKRNINQKNNIIDECTYKINDLQSDLNKHISRAEPSLVDVLIYKEQIESDITYNEQADLLMREIDSLNKRIIALDINMKSSSSKRLDIQSDILSSMNELMAIIDPQSNIHFNDIFTKSDATFSGSEEQEFYFCKIISLNKVLNHNFPIIIDSFRNGEVSTDKENLMLKVYKSLGKQVILSSTLKKEEYYSDKYNDEESVNAIDYSSNNDSKILSEQFVPEFKTIIKAFGIEF